MAYVITQNCCNDASCVEVCPVDCIHPAPDEAGFGTAEMLYINPEDCIDCGACVDACPVGAVHAELDLPPHLEAYAAVNADFFDWIGDPLPVLGGPTPPKPALGADVPTLQVAVVGSGPAGWYTVHELLGAMRSKVEITVFDRLPAPYGLVRHGVAPDHLGTKSVTASFESALRRGTVHLRLNVEIGTDISHADLLEHFHAVVYATGAPEGRALGIPGEDLPGSHSAAQIVGWYNGHPDHAGLRPSLRHPRAVVIGNGNVALDIARILLSDAGTLEQTDIAPHALEALADSAIEEVVIVGRRSARHAAFTAPELRALMQHPTFAVLTGADGVADIEAALAETDERTEATFALHQKAELLTEAGSSREGKRVVLRFGLVPERILGDRAVTGISFRGTDGSEVWEAGLVVRATGYRSVGVGGVPFDHAVGRFLHEGGRIGPRTYTAGWAKRGPSGVIGTNRSCAAETVAALIADGGDGHFPMEVADLASLDDLLLTRNVAVVRQEGWNALDDHERTAGAQTGRPRAKVADWDEQLRVASAPMVRR